MISLRCLKGFILLWCVLPIEPKGTEVIYHKLITQSTTHKVRTTVRLLKKCMDNIFKERKQKKGTGQPTLTNVVKTAIPLLNKTCTASSTEENQAPKLSPSKTKEDNGATKDIKPSPSRFKSKENVGFVIATKSSSKIKSKEDIAPAKAIKSPFSETQPEEKIGPAKSAKWPSFKIKSKKDITSPKTSSYKTNSKENAGLTKAAKTPFSKIKSVENYGGAKTTKSSSKPEYIKSKKKAAVPTRARKIISALNANVVNHSNTQIVTKKDDAGPTDSDGLPEIPSPAPKNLSLSAIPITPQQSKLGRTPKAKKRSKKHSWKNNRSKQSLC
ncbi:hypothetical protein BIW11_12990 [Tropilaelaps mercedesae]|nr:hypothetical protein BIW11_12990 [Tropilaelaps mercedesae]